MRTFMILIVLSSVGSLLSQGQSIPTNESPLPAPTYHLLREDDAIRVDKYPRFAGIVEKEIDRRREQSSAGYVRWEDALALALGAVALAPLGTRPTRVIRLTSL
jgi:hypothetical protein